MLMDREHEKRRVWFGVTRRSTRVLGPFPAMLVLSNSLLHLQGSRLDCETGMVVVAAS
jgi:hypothetical protein